MTHPKNKVNGAIQQIVRSVQGIVEEAKDNDFKRKCLKILEADDFSDFQDRATSTLSSLFKYRHGGGSLKKTINKETTTGITQQEKKNHYSPVRKRSRKEPLKLSATVPSNIKGEINHVKIENGKIDKDVKIDNKDVAPSRKLNEKEGWNLGKDPSLSPSCVDVSKLCDFINGVDNQIDMWLTDVPPGSQKHKILCDSKNELVADSKSVTITIDSDDDDDDEDDDTLIPGKYVTITTSVAMAIEDDVTIVDFEQTLNDVKDILRDPHQLKSALHEDNKLDTNRVKPPLTSTEEYTQNQPKQSSQILKDLPSTPHGVVNIDEENSQDWFAEFENDEFWGQPNPEKTQEVVVNAFDLDAVELFNIEHRK